MVFFFTYILKRFSINRAYHSSHKPIFESCDMEKKKDDLDLGKMSSCGFVDSCAPNSQTFGGSGQFLRQSSSSKHPSKYFDEGRLFHNGSTVSDNMSAIPWKNESPFSEVNESMLCDKNMPSQIKKKGFGFSEDQYQKSIDRSDSCKILSNVAHSDYIASLRRVNSQDGRPVSTNTSLRSTLLDYESRNSSRFSNPRHSARGKKRTLSTSPFSSEIFDLAEIIRTSPNSLVAYVTSNDANGFVSRGSGRNSSAASRASNGSFGHLSIGSVKSSPIGVSKARSQHTISFDSIHQREKQYNHHNHHNQLNQHSQHGQHSQYSLNCTYVHNNSNLDNLTMLLNYQQESVKNSLPKPETQSSTFTFLAQSSSSDVQQLACKNQRNSLYVPNTASLVPHPPLNQHHKLVNNGDERKNEQRSSLSKDNSSAQPNVFIEEDSHTGLNQTEETKPSGDAESEEEESGPVDLCCGWKNCSIKFDSQLQLVHHVNTDHIQKNKKDCSCYWQGCSRGEKSFKAMYMLVVHVRRHTGEKPHKCHYKDCIKAYSRLENLKTHLRSHTGERPYLCEIPGCNKAFSNASDRAKHQNRTHSDVKQYGCKVDGCSKRYTDPSSLRKHMKTVHSVLPQPTKKFRGERPFSGKKPFEGQTSSRSHSNEIGKTKQLKSESSQSHFNPKKQSSPTQNVMQNASPFYYIDSDYPTALNEISSHYDTSEFNYSQPCSARDSEVQLQASSPRVISNSIKPINLAAEELINRRYSIMSSRNLSNRRVSNGSVGSLESNNSSGYESYSNSRRESDMSLQSVLTGEKYSSILMNQLAKDISPRSNAKNCVKELLSETITEDNNNNYFEQINRGSCISSGYGSTNNYFPLSKSPEKPNTLSLFNFRRASEGNANRISDKNFGQQNKSPHFRRSSEPVEVTSLIENTPRRHSMTSYNKLPLAPSMNQTNMEVEMKNNTLPVCQPEEDEVQLSRFIQNNEIVMNKSDIQNLLVTHMKNQTTFSTKGSSSLKKQFETDSRIPDEDYSRFSNVDPLTSFVENYDMTEPNDDVWYDLLSNQTNRVNAHSLPAPIHSFQNQNDNNNTQLNKRVDGLRNAYLSDHLQYLQPDRVSEKQCNERNHRIYDECGSEYSQNKHEKPIDLTLKWRDSHFSRQQIKFDSNAINVEDLLSTNLDALCTETLENGPTTNMVLNTMDILLDSFVEENMFYENQAFRRFSVIYE